MSPLPKGLRTGLTAKLPSSLRKLSDRPSKFNNRATWRDGIEFASIAEAARYDVLKLLEQSGLISDLQLQPRFVLQDAFVDIHGKKVREIAYVADFAYTVAGAKTIVEDVKGGKATQTRVFANKAKQFRKRYPNIELRIVTNPNQAY